MEQGSGLSTPADAHTSALVVSALVVVNSAAVYLAATALIISVAVMAVMISPPVWAPVLSLEVLFVTSVAVVPTLVVWSVFILLRPRLQQARSSVAATLVVLIAVGFGILALAVASASVAFDAADAGTSPDLFARLFPGFAGGAVLLVWGCLSVVSFCVGATTARPVQRRVAAASTGFALTIAASVAALTPVAHCLCAAALLVFIALHSRAGKHAAAISPATPRA